MKIFETKHRIKEISRKGYQTFIPQYKSIFGFWNDYTYTDGVNGEKCYFKYSFDTLEEAKEFIKTGKGKHIKYHYDL